MNELKQSIQDKLRNLAKAHGKDFQMILTRYFQERILYRISVSPFTNNFCLKGGALLYAISEEMSRPTLDIDFLAIDIQRDQKKVEAIFRKICSQPYPLDGIEIQVDGISVKEIMEHKRYIGIRVKIPISLGNMRQFLTIDIGFSDQVVPAPVKMTYPTLLDMEEPVVIAYSSVSVIAEKFEAMIDLGEMNSRMKDFYDVWQLLISGNIDKEDLKKAIEKTFKIRKTPLTKNHPLFQSDFALDPQRQKMWDAFVRRSKLVNAPAFPQVMDLIANQLSGIYNYLLSQENHSE